MAEIPALQSSYAAGEIAPSLQARVDLAKYRVGLKLQRNFYSVVGGGSINRPGTQFIGEIVNSAAVGRVVRFKYSTTDTYCLEFGNLTMRVIRNGAYVESSPGVLFSLATPYVTAHLPLLKFNQSFDKVTITHPTYPTKTLTRTGHAAWTLTDITFAPETAAPTGFTSSSGAGGVFYAITAVNDETGEESLALEGSAADRVSTLTFTPTAGCSSYNVYNLNQGIYGFIGSCGTTGFTDATIVPDNSITPPQARNPFSSTDNYPSCSSYYVQRAIYANTNVKPQTVFTSVAGAFNNMCVSRPTQDDDAITKALVSREANEIRNMVPLDDLLLCTSGGLWKGTASGAAVTPATLAFFQQTYDPIGDLPPIVAGEDVLFVHEYGAPVYRVSFEAISTRWRPAELSVLSRHFFDGTWVADWCYASTPHNLIWAVMGTGTLLTLTYLKEQEVYAWAFHDVGGFVESICSVPENREDAVYMIVRRTVNGATKRYVERLHSRIFQNVADGWFLDCALRYSGAPATVISGLDHLEGEEVVALADGVVVRGLTVTSGDITLATAASVVLVGLDYVSIMQTLGVEVQPTIQGKLRKPNAVTLSMLSSRGGYVGPTSDALSAIPYEPLGAVGSATELFTGDVRINVANDYDQGGSIMIRQQDPLPMTVRSDTIELTVG